MTIYAAGVVCWREVGGKLEFLLVHREKYNDWGFAKGKLDPGEVLPETAVREVMEETGIKVRLGRKLSVIEYQVDKGENKEVHYWASKITQKAINKQKFTPNQEIAKVEWHGAKESLALLSYEHDRDLLEDVILLHKKKELETRALIILRHAAATPRGEWGKGESTRPLLGKGKVQADRLVQTLSAYSPKTLITSPWKRCKDTVLPYSKSSGRKLIERSQLSEHSAVRNPKKTERLVEDVFRGANSTLICTHRPALPKVLKSISQQADIDLKPAIIEAATLDPSAFIVIRLTMGKNPIVASIERLDPIQA